MKKNRGFTLIEMVIVLAVAGVLFAMIAGLSVLTSNLVISQKNTSICLSQYQSGKSKIEEFISTYSYDYFQFVLDEEKPSKIEILNSDDECVARAEFDESSYSLNIYEIENDVLNLTKEISISNVRGIVYEFDESSNLLKCKFTFSDLDDRVFMINVGGMKIGY